MVELFEMTAGYESVLELFQKLEIKYSAWHYIGLVAYKLGMTSGPIQFMNDLNSYCIDIRQYFFAYYC